MRLTEIEVASHVDAVTVEELRVWVREGLIAPARGDAGPIYDEVDLARVRLACELRDDFGLDEDGLGVVLSLIDQLHGLRSELKALARAIDRAPQDARAAIRAAYRELSRRRD